MKENDDLQPMNNEGPGEDTGQAQDQNTDATPDPIIPEGNEPQSDTPGSEESTNESSDTESVQEELVPLDDTKATPSATAEADSLDSGNSENTAAGKGNGGGSSKGWMIASLLLAAALIVVLIVNPFSNNGKEAVATVNDTEITKDDLYNKMVEAGGQQTLEALITEELIDQEVAKKSIAVTDEQINEEIDALKSMFPSEEAFNQAMASSGLTLDMLKEQTKRQVELTQLMGDKVKVTDEELKEFWDQYKDNFATPEQIRASHILVDTKEEAEEIIKQLQDGADFATLAKEKSKDPGSKENGGDLNFFARDSGMDPAFEDAAFKLEKGKFTTEPVKTSFGYHVIKVTDHKEATNPTFEEKKEDIRKQLVSSKVSQQYYAYVEELKGKAKITNTLEQADDKTASETAEAPAN